MNRHYMYYVLLNLNSWPPCSCSFVLMCYQQKCRLGGISPLQNMSKFTHAQIGLDNIPIFIIYGLLFFHYII